MAYQGNISPAQVNAQLNNVHYDVKMALRATQSEITQLISDLGDPDKTTITVDGRVIKKSDTVTLQLAVSNKLEQLSNQSTTILSVFSELYKLEKSLGGTS
jgi:archaellum component FlaF (FlaF/FlaG flagellin family)